ncbi:MAG: IS1 family transposase, partial [Anaerolineaceae bacterium]
MKCPRCQSREKQYKVGFNPSGSQKYRCYDCG